MRFPRASGVLLHPTSLPGPHGSGDFGADAYHFVDWLVCGGQTLWQVLPLAGIGPGNSPYMSSSAFAGNVLLIDLAELHRQGWLDAADLVPAHGLDATRVAFATMVPFRMQRLAKAAQRFAAGRERRAASRPRRVLRRASELARRLRALHGPVRGQPRARLVRLGALPGRARPASAGRGPRRACFARRVLALLPVVVLPPMAGA